MLDRRRTVFFVSDGTGITVEMLGHSLLTQFDGVESTHETIPFIDSVEKARACVERINSAPRPAGRLTYAADGRSVGDCGSSTLGDSAAVS